MKFMLVEVFLEAANRKPSAKAPVIDPGDEAPFLVRGGEEERAARRA
jgi:hypothetical protein